jgi:ABC-2 type transport system permease protein
MRPMLKLTWVELKLFTREPLAVIFVFVFPLFMLFVLAGVFGNDLQNDNPDDIELWHGVGPVDYYQPAYVGLLMASIGFVSMPLRLTAYREQGVLRRFRAAGVSRGAVIASQVLISLAMVIVGTIAIVVAAKVGYGTANPVEPVQTVLAFAMGSAVFAAIGVLLGAVLPGLRAAQGAGIISFFVMMLISGGGPPRGALSSGMLFFSDLLPLTHVILLLQSAWLGWGWDWSAMAVCLGFLGVAGALSYRFFRWE